MSAPVKVLRCSFCGRPDQDVDDLVAGPDAYICGDCSDMAHSLVLHRRRRRAIVAARIRAEVDAKVSASILPPTSESIEDAEDAVTVLIDVQASLVAALENIIADPIGCAANDYGEAREAIAGARS